MLKTSTDPEPLTQPIDGRQSIMNSEQQIVPGIVLSSSGQALIDPSIKEVLFDLACCLEEPTNLPVDIEHVVAALVLAARNEEIDTTAIPAAGDSALLAILAVHVKSVFARYGGIVGSDE
jgi:hypothetical protein